MESGTSNPSTKTKSVPTSKMVGGTALARSVAERKGSLSLGDTGGMAIKASRRIGGTR